MLGPGLSWKLGAGDVIVSLNILDGESCCINYMERCDQIWKLVAAPRCTAKCFALQYLLLSWRQMSYHNGVCSIKERKSEPMQGKRMAVGATENNKIAESTS